MKNAKNCLYELGNAIGNDWGNFDGREMRNYLDIMVDVLDGKITLYEYRNKVNICQNGGGHWRKYCDNSCKNYETYEDYIKRKNYMKSHQAHKYNQKDFYVTEKNNLPSSSNMPNVSNTTETELNNIDSSSSSDGTYIIC